MLVQVDMSSRITTVAYLIGNPSPVIFTPVLDPPQRNTRETAVPIVLSPILNNSSASQATRLQLELEGICLSVLKPLIRQWI